MIRTVASAFVVAALLAVTLPGCKKPYRVGDRVWVEWEGREYPAFILEIKSANRFRVHFEGYDERWNEDVTPERIKGLAEGEVTPPPPPPQVTRALGAPRAAASAGPASPFKVGDAVRVRWRGSIYGATIIEVVSRDRVKVHYDGHEDAWDEVVSLERITGRR